ncbi:hypothetical protein [Streptomyces sp. NPDC102264]|uniref:hypothetical protein n=1 Tax=Streptomyces sp. NPDC102264 TaxID=3366149 RepID=UPI0037F81861
MTRADLDLIRRALWSLINYGSQDDESPARTLLADQGGELMFGPTQPTIEEQREAFTSGLMQIRENVVTPLFDAADGMKADLLARGWSPEVVDYLAGAWLAAMLAKVGAA